MFEFEAVILLCTGVSWREDVLRFNRRESVNNFVKKNKVKASEFLLKGYTGEIRKDRCKGGGGVLIAMKQEYDIQRIELEANISAETVWATISLKDQRKLVVGSYYRPPDSGSDLIDDLESVLSFITEKFQNNPQCTIILGGDFNAGDIDWESHSLRTLSKQAN